MLDIIKKHWLSYVFEIVISIIIYNVIGLGAFLIYVYIMLILKIDIVANYLRKLIRVNWVENEIKLYGIMRKLKMTDKEIVEWEESQKNMFNKEQRTTYEKDVKDIIL